MWRINRIALGALLSIVITFYQIEEVAAQSSATGVKNVVLIHGAFADGSSWAKVIPLLEARGLHVVAVQNPLSSLEDDVAAAKRAIALQNGPVLLIGHSWGGVVISQAGTDPKVAGLVYVAAFAPDDNESLVDASKAFPPTPGLAEAKPDAAGFLALTAKGIHEDFCPDLPLAERKIVLATQGPWAASCTTAKISKAAWKVKPSWYIVASEDRMINPDLERKFARTMKATTLEVKASHVPMLSQPKQVADFISEAARKVSPQ
ncbi:alpha/beta fold hydrolase [Spirosoma endophyticum]|uniref:Pimeloyl-ACP methyl ester carboxylesterase n=1 Tax=Spirosoma endophyticum TaxID=662367 RepID=A0A1I1FT24_9BACT|nr:alpha/beta hydrolase [Spirosoma endophyticum]SFC02156.1 Pimeloyl-ACP methyl ester carboxylesterase [Spirosoma endophyticum]